MDTLVLDIETKNTFGDVGGKDRLLKLLISVACFYSYNQDKYFSFYENQFEEAKKFLETRARLVGFSSNKFDIPLLAHNLGLDLMSYPRIDISDEIELRTGRLIGLNDLAHLNLGEVKTHKGLDAPVLYAAGKMEELKEYCLQDVKITKDLFDKLKKSGELILPARRTSQSDEPSILEINLSENPDFM